MIRITTTNPSEKGKSTTLVMLEERLRWAYQGSMNNSGRIEWNQINKIEREIEEYYRTH